MTITKMPMTRAAGRMFARAFTVFNVAQVDGYEPEPIAMLPENERFVHAHAFVEALKIPVVVGAYDAHYRIDLDQIKSREELEARVQNAPPNCPEQTKRVAARLSAIIAAT